MTDARCERSDLPASMCAHCRGHVEPVRRPRAPLVVPPLGFTEARYEGWCGECGERIWKGEKISPAFRRMPNGSDKTIWICEECAGNA
jgi:uncharacterized protein with PIN domain